MFAVRLAIGRLVVTRADLYQAARIRHMAGHTHIEVAVQVCCLISNCNREEVVLILRLYFGCDDYSPRSSIKMHRAIAVRAFASSLKAFHFSGSLHCVP